MSRPERTLRTPGTSQGPGPSRGLSLVELMVGLVVSMLVAMAAMSGAQLFNASQRQGVGVGASTVSVAGTLSAIKQDLAQAGLGFFGESNYLCPQLNLAVGGTIYSNGGAFSPVAITREASGSDKLTVAHADAIAAGSNIRLKGSTDGVSTAQLQTFLPMPAAIPATGVSVLLAPAPGGTATLCTVRSVTAVTAANAAAGTPLTVTFGAAGTNNTGATFANQPSYVADDRIAYLGNQLSISIYRIDANRNLVLDQPLNNVNGVVLARNVMAFRAEYGVSADINKDNFDHWQSAASGAPWIIPGTTQIEQIRAMRIGIVTRSADKEKPATPGDDSTCTASTAKPTLFPANATDVIEPDVTGWKCYRYRTVTAIVPLRNMVLGK